MKRFKKGFTLAEVLITLAIIGVVAAISIPSVISNSQQQEFKTGLRKAVSVLNSAITMNMAIDGESPYDNKDLFRYLQRHMSILMSTTNIQFFVAMDGHGNSNSAFYTTDGMRFEMENIGGKSGPYLHEKNIRTCIPSAYYNDDYPNNCDGCGSYGLNNNPNGTTKVPCVILVDVNGDRKPSPQNAACRNTECSKNNFYKYPKIKPELYTDIFTIMITEDRAIPFGTSAQRAMYQAQK